MTRRPVLAAVGLAVLLAAVGVASLARRAAPPSGELLPYQRPVAQLPAAEQERFAQLEAALRVAEQARSSSGQWPPSLSASAVTWVRRQQGVYVNYLGLPAEPSRLRWLVLVIEPAPAALKDPVPPEDEEHHTLADGTGIHVSLWSAPNQGPPPEVVVPFPAADEWTQRLRGKR